MNYQKLLGRAWNLIWAHKFLILLGILVALGGSGGSGSISSGTRPLSRLDQEWHLPIPPGWRGAPIPPARELDLPVISTLVPLVLVGVVLIIAMAVWVLSTLARGALIAGASEVDADRAMNFGQAFAVAWQKGWTLLGIGVFPAIPTLALFLGALGAAAIYVGLPPVIDVLDQVAGPRAINIGLILGMLTCVALPFIFVLNLLRAFANRACMLEDCGVIAAYKRGFSVLIDNIGSGLLLFLIQVAVGIALGLVLVLPALCCLLWPLLLLVQGTAAAYFSTMWTLAWRLWTSAAPAA